MRFPFIILINLIQNTTSKRNLLNLTKMKRYLVFVVEQGDVAVSFAKYIFLSF